MPGTMPRSPSTGRPSGPTGIPPRIGEEDGGKRNGPIVAMVVGAVVLLLGASCFLVFNISGGFKGLQAAFAGPTPTATAITVQVPNFKNLPLASAQSLAKDNNMTLTVVYATPDPTDANPPAKNTVLDQNPEPGPARGPLTSVTITVASGPNQVQVPDVSGLSDVDACDKLQKAKLVCQFGGIVQSNQPASTVVRTDPVAGSMVDPDHVVLYFLSAGPATPTPSPTAVATETPVTPVP
jgi:serine/threonine-protein kinase